VLQRTRFITNQACNDNNIKATLSEQNLRKTAWLSEGSARTPVFGKMQMAALKSALADASLARREVLLHWPHCFVCYACMARALSECGFPQDARKYATLSIKYETLKAELDRVTQVLQLYKADESKRFVCAW
jgi:hypothetical protein